MKKSPAPSVEFAARILDLLSSSKYRKSSLTEISQALSINISSCLRVMRVLNQYQLVKYDMEGKKYSLGDNIIVLGIRASDFSDELSLSRPYLKSLCTKTGLTSVLVKKAPKKDMLMYVAKEEPFMDGRISVNLGRYFHITGASSGKCFLAFMEEEEIDRIIRGAEKKQMNSFDVEEFKQSLNEVRLQGFIYSVDKYAPGVGGIMAPIFSFNGEVSMVIGCLGTSAFFKESGISDIRESVVNTAAAITKILSGVEATV
jgi:DNA-binding IclR family transcriptional regulator